ncbi:MAG: HAD-IA family hydrolase [Patescibacteria group bacterium]|nr:HAD-IA family hydrolase [Patescibacteria group bacterium]
MKTIIFDFDGVIHNTFELAYNINVKVLGKNLTKEEYKDFFNGNIFKREEMNKKNVEKFFKMQNKAFKYLKLEKNIKKILKKLSKKYTLFIISSNQESALNTYFQNNKFVHIFKEILGAETHKSKVEKFKYLFKKYNLKVDGSVFITDTLGDILEGHKFGIRTIAVDFGFHDRERLKKGKPFKIVSNFDEMLKIIENTRE